MLTSHTVTNEAFGYPFPTALVRGSLTGDGQPVDRNNPLCIIHRGGCSKCAHPLGG